MMSAADNDDYHDDYDGNENDESVHLFHCALVPICASIACTHLDDHVHIYCARRNIRFGGQVGGGVKKVI